MNDNSTTETTAITELDRLKVTGFALVLNRDVEKAFSGLEAGGDLPTCEQLMEALKLTGQFTAFVLDTLGHQNKDAKQHH